MAQQPLSAGVLKRIRVLFFAEAVTLAHVARPLALGMALDPARYEIFFACDQRYRHFVNNEHWIYRPLRSISSHRFLQALAQGSPVYDEGTLRDYVREDLALIDEIKPDVIVGDFRLSLSVSARLRGVPYLAIASAYWSAYSARKDFPLPVLPMTRFMPIAAARFLFAMGRRVAFAYHTLPLNRVRREYDLPSLGRDLRHIYTDADYVLFADVPDLFPTIALPSTHRYLGPILWSPPVPKPPWWDALPQQRPIVYVTLGSSGVVKLLPVLLEALSTLQVSVIVATAGVSLVNTYPDHVYTADYLPGLEAAARADLVICNGGSPTSQQALAASVPVLGIAGNIDQFLNMDAVVKSGAGVLMRADRASVAAIRALVPHLLSTAAYTQAAKKVGEIFGRYSAPDRFAAVVAETASGVVSSRSV